MWDGAGGRDSHRHYQLREDERDRGDHRLVDRRQTGRCDRGGGKSAGRREPHERRALRDEGRSGLPHLGALSYRVESPGDDCGEVAGPLDVDCTIRSTTNAVIKITIRNPATTTRGPRTRLVSSMGGTYRRCRIAARETLDCPAPRVHATLPSCCPSSPKRRYETDRAPAPQAAPPYRGAHVRHVGGRRRCRLGGSGISRSGSREGGPHLGAPGLRVPSL